MEEGLFNTLGFRKEFINFLNLCISKLLLFGWLFSIIAEQHFAIAQTSNFSVDNEMYSVNVSFKSFCEIVLYQILKV